MVWVRVLGGRLVCTRRFLRPWSGALCSAGSTRPSIFELVGPRGGRGVLGWQMGSFLGMLVELVYRLGMVLYGGGTDNA